MTTKWAGWIVAALALAALAAGAVYAATNTAEVRITARQLEDGRVEFALQQRVDGEWGERQLPASRFFPADVGHNRWLNSTPITVSVAEEQVAAPAVSTGSTGAWNSTIHEADWSGRQDVEMWVPGSARGWQLRLTCEDGRRNVAVWHYEEFEYDFDSGVNAVQWRLGQATTTHKGQWWFSEPSWDSRWFTPHSGWLQSLIGQPSVSIQFGAGRWAKTVTFDIRGMDNVDAWATISACVDGYISSNSTACPSSSPTAIYCD